MNFKYLMILSLMFIISIGAVSAAEIALRDSPSF